MDHLQELNRALERAIEEAADYEVIDRAELLMDVNELVYEEMNKRALGAREARKLGTSKRKGKK